MTYSTPPPPPPPPPRIYRAIFLTLFSVAITGISASAQTGNVHIPDANFKNALLANTKINTDADKNNISYAEAKAYNGAIKVSFSNVKTLKGIEAFTSLTSLSCFKNQLTTLNVSKNTELTYLRCNDNQLTTLDISKNTQLTSLDCENNLLTTLDVSKNTKLTVLGCGANRLTTLDVSKNTKLTYLDCDYNQLTTLDVSNNTQLTWLRCDRNQLKAINLKNGYNKNLTSFDATKNPQLTCLQVDDATAFGSKWGGEVDQPNVISSNCIVKVSAITIKTTDGSNTISTNGGTLQFVAKADPSTATDKSVTWSVDNPSIAHIDKHGTLIGVASDTVKVTATSQDGSGVVSNSITVIITQQRTKPVVNILDANFKKALLANHSINTNKDKEIQLYEANTFFGKLVVRKNSIKDLAGIEAFTSLTELYCNKNQLTTLNVSKNTQLTELWCGSSKLRVINLKNGNNTKLSSF